ncbi:Hypothetical protein I595_2963 [Croceitalea dokdonensis DOKDO 023]|uniref:Uncharacterized protein n=1 Tax=Croceitalea dokdonensis DOKDO 023 TaxID=1300341 RepID=A0A0P7AQI1_9FLAO|nr:Hypothetical protein I595_2963 [Croceitalea dokdonensis DOKDO 023]
MGCLPKADGIPSCSSNFYLGKITKVAKITRGYFFRLQFVHFADDCNTKQGFF